MDSLLLHPAISCAPVMALASAYSMSDAINSPFFMTSRTQYRRSRSLKNIKINGCPLSIGLFDTVRSCESVVTNLCDGTSLLLDCRRTYPYCREKVLRYGLGCFLVYLFNLWNLFDFVFIEACDFVRCRPFF